MPTKEKMEKQTSKRSQYFQKNFLVTATLILLLCEAGVWSAYFFEKNTAVLLAASILAGAIAIGLGAFIVVSFKKYVDTTFSSLVTRLNQLDKGGRKELSSQSSMDEIVEAVAQISNTFKQKSNKAAAFQEFIQLLLKAKSSNAVIKAVATSLKQFPSIEAAASFLLKERRKGVLYPLFPMDIARISEYRGEDDKEVLGVIQAVTAPVYKKRGEEQKTLNLLEKIFFDRGYERSLTLPIRYKDEFFGLIGVASNRKEGWGDEDVTFLDGVVNMASLTLANMERAVELHKKAEEVIDLKHSGREKIEKQLTELKEAYNKVVQAGKMASLGELSAGVAHELNNPIGGILGYAQLILTKLRKSSVKKEDVETAVKYLELMEKESQRCQWIISNLLNFSRKPETEMGPTDVKQVLENTVSMMELQLANRKVKLSVSLPKEDLKQIQGNSNQLQQVFTNLIQNAADVMPDGGQISVSAENKKDHKYTPPVEYLELRFADTGPGIPKEHLDKIFDPFFTSKVGKAGTGLGLSISFTIISAHKGFIKAESEVGVGTTFIILLPVMKKTGGGEEKK